MVYLILCYTFAVLNVYSIYKIKVLHILKLKEWNIFSVMTLFDKEKLIEVVLYIIYTTQGLDYYHIFKILYFAQQKHLCKWGSRIVEDDFVAMEYGPVPTELYSAVCNKECYAKELIPLFTKAIKFAGKDAPNTLLPKREPNMEYLSPADIESLNESIAENKGLSFGELVNKSHDSAWYATRDCDIISVGDIAKAGGASDGFIEYINEQEFIQKALA